MTATSDHGTDEHDLGLLHDLQTMRRYAGDLVAAPAARFDRRGALRLLGGAGLLALVGCGSSATDTGAAATSTSSAGSAGSAATTAAASSGSCAVIPQETGGPFPGDGTNGPNALTQSGVVRRDIRSSFGSSTTAAKGVPLSVTLTVQQASTCTPLAGAAVYLWHCDTNGKYSMYDLPNENYLRGVQETASDGTVTFETIYPAAYSGRWPHIHFEVFQTLAKATAAGAKLRTSQLALPEAASKLVYATAGYEQSVSRLAQTSLARDMVFSDDGGKRQTPTYTGDATKGFTMNLSVPV
jgi:protocatechuate 3,4-dioxygenase beta subunit